MRRRTRVDLGQQINAKEDERLERKRQRWAKVNKGSDPFDNPFIKAISPGLENYGDPSETDEEIRLRLSNFEYGNFPGYFNYRNKASVNEKANDDQKTSQIDELEGTSCYREKHQKNDHNNESKTCLDQGLSDERFEHLREDWFRGKIVLDVGCNRGHITYAIARKFSPKFVVGIDIDAKMVDMANRDMHLYLESDLIKRATEIRLEELKRLELRDDIELLSNSSEKEKSNEEQKLTSSLESNQYPISSYVSFGPLALSDSQNENTFPNNLIFVEHNYVPSSDDVVSRQKAHYDTILCLSVTKWIHLNYCDDGLKRFFKRTYNHLKEGGLLILEAQPFDNYNRRKRLSERLKKNFYNIQFKPEDFDSYLLSDEIGFKKIIYESRIEHECKGFKRPIKVFLK